MNFISLVIYNISLRFYWLGIWLAMPFNTKAKQWIEGRRNWKQRMAPIKNTAGKRIWFHCASLGEFEQARPVIERWRNTHSNDTIILTFFSPSGYEVRRNYEYANLVLYLPLDTSANANEFLNIIQPDIALFVKYEFWHHYLSELNKRNIPTILFSSVFRSEQAFFQWYGSFFRHMLSLYTRILVQDEQSKQLLEGISVAAQINPDTRFDRVQQVMQNRKPIAPIEKFKGSSKILIAGSTWGRDEAMLATLIKNNIPEGYKYIIVPHNVTAGNIAELQSNVPYNILLSELNEANASSARVLIVDNVGQLAWLYGYADIAYVGGGFNTSVHNVLEAAVYNIPVVFGPNYHKSVEALTLLQRSAAFTYNTYSELENIMLQLATGQSKYNPAAAQQYISANLGGSEKVYSLITAYTGSTLSSY